MDVESMDDMNDSLLFRAAAELIFACRERQLRIAIAESCTGGLIAATLTEIPGASDVLDRALVVYSNQAKIDLLGIPAGLITEHGAVSEAVAVAMSEGTLAHSTTDLALAVTGIAGPDGGSPNKPVGTVHIAVTRRGRTTEHQRFVFAGERFEVREASAMAGIAMLAGLLTVP